MVVVEAEVWELKLPRLLMAGYRGRAAPPYAGGLYGCCRCARAHVRCGYAPVHACDKTLRCEKGIAIVNSGCGGARLEG